MNTTIQQLHARKSTRAFTDRPIDPVHKAAILEAAVQAPTAGNQQLYTILDITDPELQQDLVNVFEEWIPTQRTEGMYLHPQQKALDFAEEHGEGNFGCHNTDAHLRSSVIGRNVTIVAVDGEMDLGEFGRIHFIDWDQTRGRTRTVQVMIIGE